MSFDYSNSGIEHDNFAELIKKEHRPPCISDLFDKISNDFNSRKVKSITKLDISKNRCSANRILQYCFDNKDGFFSTDDFEYLDLSRTIIEYYDDDDDDKENLMKLVCNLLNKYPNLTINLSYTAFDSGEWRDKCIKINPYKDIDIKSRLILEYRAKCEERWREREYCRKTHCYNCQCFHCFEKHRYTF